MQRRSLVLGLLLGSTTLLPLSAAGAIDSVERQADAVVLHSADGIMRLQVWSDRVIRVSYAPGTVLPQDKSLSVVGHPQRIDWKMSETAEILTVETSSVRARVDRKTEAVVFLDQQGNTILQELVPGREFRPTPVEGITGTSVRDTFALSPGEQYYGLGQHPNGHMSYRGIAVRLLQQNGDVGIPFSLSSRGYGLFWDNPAVTDIDIGIPGKESEVSWKSEIGTMLDYYFVYGPSADSIIQSYRELTGKAPLLAKWAWGFFQCKERYSSQDELIDIVSQYRKRKSPIDGIIQDWQYWPKGGWGSHEFEASRYPDPGAMVKTLHELNTHVLVSVWSRFDLETENGKELARAGAMYDPVLTNVYPPGQGRWYDAFSSEGRRIYWKQISDKLFKLGFDGWWLDATEAELGGKWGEFRGFRTAVGPGATVYNAYPLMTTTGVYRGQREQTDKKRVLILTRSAYAGQQRNSAITWSGDTQGTWESFVKQVPAGLNFSASGIPYWNTDIGGFFGGKTSDPNYQELFTRWFQYGAFTPMFRVHGTGDGKELWKWDESTQRTLDRYVRLRYRLLPYIYSVSWQVTNNGGTMMRPLVMDFANDAEALNVPDQYLFGPAIMVNPVTQKGAKDRTVYLPGNGIWYDFWTGKQRQAGHQLVAAAPIDIMPLYVRAGAILPLGPQIQYAGEIPADPIELRVYRGANGTFTLYEDEGDSYNYEKGVYATIPISWDEASGVLTIGRRKGTFPGMLKDRTFRVVFAHENHGTGVTETTSADQTIRYDGRKIFVKAQNVKR